MAEIRRYLGTPADQWVAKEAFEGLEEEEQ